MSSVIKDKTGGTTAGLSRRGLLRMGLGGLVAATGMVSMPAIVGAAALSTERRLDLVRAHSEERVSQVYRIDDWYDPDALAALDHLFRDTRNGVVHAMDPALYDLLSDLQWTLGRSRPLHVVSAYRSPETNAKLVAQDARAARKSFHIQGKAVDVRMTGTPSAAIRDAAVSLRRGGVGHYAKSNLVHLDVGPVRRW